VKQNSLTQMNSTKDVNLWQFCRMQIDCWTKRSTDDQYQDQKNYMKQVLNYDKIFISTSTQNSLTKMSCTKVVNNCTKVVNFW